MDILLISPAQCRAARALLEMDQNTLAAAANVSRGVIIDFEKGRRTPGANNMTAIRRVLDAAGVEFFDDEKGQGLRLKAGQPDPELSRDIKQGDLVKYREDRLPPNLKNVGLVGKVEDPGHKAPVLTHVYLRFPNGDEAWTDRSALVLAPPKARPFSKSS